MIRKRDDSGFFEQVYRAVRLIPRGKVATYGQIADILGRPRGARTVGWALRSLQEGSDVPWHRVINARGEISLGGGEGAAIQRALLEEEGVAFDAQGRVDLGQYRWAGPPWPEIERLRRRED